MDSSMAPKRLGFASPKENSRNGPRGFHGGRTLETVGGFKVRIAVFNILLFGPRGSHISSCSVVRSLWHPPRPPEDVVGAL